MPDEFAMSRLMTTTHYEARVLVARLGSEGILAESRQTGSAADPAGPVQVWVLSKEMDTAKALLAVEPVVDDPDYVHNRRDTKRFAAFLLFSLIVMIVVPVAKVLLG